MSTLGSNLPLCRPSHPLLIGFENKGSSTAATSSSSTSSSSSTTQIARSVLTPSSSYSTSSSSSTSNLSQSASLSNNILNPKIQRIQQLLTEIGADFLTIADKPPEPGEPASETAQFSAQFKTVSKAQNALMNIKALMDTPASTSLKAGGVIFSLEKCLRAIKHAFPHYGNRYGRYDLINVLEHLSVYLQLQPEDALSSINNLTNAIEKPTTGLHPLNYPN